MFDPVATENPVLFCLVLLDCRWICWFVLVDGLLRFAKLRWRTRSQLVGRNDCTVFWPVKQECLLFAAPQLGVALVCIIHARQLIPAKQGVGRFYDSISFQLILPIRLSLILWERLIPLLLLFVLHGIQILRFVCFELRTFRSALLNLCSDL